MKAYTEPLWGEYRLRECGLLGVQDSTPRIELLEHRRTDEKRFDENFTPVDRFGSHSGRSVLKVEQKTDAPVVLNEAGRGVQVALTAVLMIVAVAAFVLGALPLISIASEWADLPVGVAALLPVVLDMGAVAAALAAIVRHSRGQRATLETALLLLTVIVSVCAQVVHAWQIAGGVWEPRTIIIAAALGSAPVIVLLASHAAIRTLTPPRQKTKRVARRDAPAPQKPASVTQARSPVEPNATKLADVKPVAVASNPRPTPPERLTGEVDLDYAIRLLLDHGYGQRRAAEIAGTTRSKVETRLKQQQAAAADQPVSA